MDKEKLIKKACYLIDLIEDVLAAVESCKPAESLPLYHYKPEEYTPAEDTLVMIKKHLVNQNFWKSHLIRWNSITRLEKLCLIPALKSMDVVKTGSSAIIMVLLFTTFQTHL